jgi:hypothetical protein
MIVRILLLATTILVSSEYPAASKPGRSVKLPRAWSPETPHLKTTGRAAELRRVKQDVYFRSLQPRRGWGVERLEATAAKHSIYVT